MDGEIIIANLKCHSFVKSLPEKYLRPLLSPQLLRQQCLVGYVDFVQDTIVIVNHNDFLTLLRLEVKMDGGKVLKMLVTIVTSLFSLQVLKIRGQMPNTSKEFIVLK